jgi:hypothetical protein
MLVLAMQFSRSADAGACGAESEDEDAGAAIRASPAEPRDEGGSLPQNRREERSSGPGSAVGRKHLLPTTSPWTGPSEAPTGSRPCVCRNLDSLERR